MKKKAILQALWFGMNVLILDENFNKNYRLRLERSYGCTVLNNHDFKEVLNEIPFSIFLKQGDGKNWRGQVIDCKHIQESKIMSCK